MNDDVREKYMKAGAIASEARVHGLDMIRPGALLLDVAESVEAEIIRLGGALAFPVNLAIDSVAAHYTPHSQDKLRFVQGELVKLDLGVHVDGYIADTAATVEVGTDRWGSLIAAARDALDMALDMMAPGIPVRTIGSAVERTIRSRGFEPVSNLTGHSLERFNLHAGVSVPNVDDGSVADLRTGMAVAIEPFATNGVGRVAGRKGGNIYRQLRERETDDSELDGLVRQMREELRYMPFSERWVAKRAEKPDRVLKRLMRRGIISSYPILSEVKNGMVSQFEHTVIIAGGQCLVTTR